MKSAKHQFNTVHGLIEVQVDIFDMDKVEAIDIYDQDAKRFSSGGWRIEGFLNGTPRGTHFYPKGMLGTSYFGEGTEDAARAFLAEAHQEGFFSTIAFKQTQLVAVPGSDQFGNLYSVYIKIPTETGFNIGDFVGEIRVKELPVNCTVLGA